MVVITRVVEKHPLMDFIFIIIEAYNNSAKKTIPIDWVMFICFQFIRRKPVISVLLL